MKIKNAPEFVYQITYNSDSTEGRGRQIDMNLYFTQLDDAIEFAKSKYYGSKWGIMGTTGSEYDVKKINSQSLIPVIYESVQEFEIKNNTKVSLSSQERKRMELNSLSKEELVAKLMK